MTPLKHKKVILRCRMMIPFFFLADVRERGPRDRVCSMQAVLVSRSLNYRLRYRYNVAHIATLQDVR